MRCMLSESFHCAILRGRRKTLLVWVPPFYRVAKRSVKSLTSFFFFFFFNLRGCVCVSIVNICGVRADIKEREGLDGIKERGKTSIAIVYYIEAFAPT